MQGKKEVFLMCIIMTILCFVAAMFPVYPICTLASLAGGICIAYRSKNLGALPLTIGLCISVIGDWGMGASSQGVIYFITGIAFFLVAHICYIIYFACHQKKTKLQIGIFIFLALGYGIWLIQVILPQVKGVSLQIAVTAYTIISIISLTTVVGLDYPKKQKLIMIIGILSLVVSDTIIASVRFLNITTLGFLIMPLYMLSHYCISISGILYDHQEG